MNSGMPSQNHMTVRLARMTSTTRGLTPSPPPSCRIYQAPADISPRHATEISGDLRIGSIVDWR